MDLLVDIGNTRLRWCCADRGRCTPAVDQPHDPEGVAALLLDHWAALPAPRRIVVANVAGARAAGAVDETARALWRGEPVHIKAQPQGYGVTNGYEQPDQLGPDRWAALVAAHQLYAGPKYIADCGTAATVDVLDEDGRHQGGLILPGLTMMRRALLGGTSDLYIDDERDPAPAVGLLARDTSAAIKAGTLHMLAAAVEGLAQDLEEVRNCRFKRIVTGGNAFTLLPLLGPGYTHDPDLVLKGLMIIAGETP